jgi:hypothetical protein
MTLAQPIQEQQQLIRRDPFALVAPGQELAELQFELAVARHQLLEDGEHLLGMRVVGEHLP